MSEQTTDSIPLADTFVFEGPSESGLCSATFYAFNTVVTLQAYATDSCSASARQEDAATEARSAKDLCGIFEAARDRCRFFENRLSRTLSRSDISRLNVGGRGGCKTRAATAFVAPLRSCGGFSTNHGIRRASVGFSPGRDS
ncbi:MAG: hypothetical protein ACLTQI_07330 [Slackia sp.]